MTTHPLDNPAWHSLSETHKSFAVDYDGIKFYQPAICPFGGFVDHSKTQNGIDKYALLTSNFFVIGDKPAFSNKVHLEKELVCDQMVIDQRIQIAISEEIIELKSIAQKNDLFALVNLVQPGYFIKNTSDMGNYYGIYQDDTLVAVTGERMKMNAWSEISAVVTHPSFVGKGYAKQLVAHTCNKIFDEGKLPYLHVTENNTRAIRVYEALGFATRRKMSFWNLVTNSK